MHVELMTTIDQITITVIGVDNKPSDIVIQMAKSGLVSVKMNNDLCCLDNAPNRSIAKYNVLHEDGRRDFLVYIFKIIRNIYVSNNENYFERITEAFAKALLNINKFFEKNKALNDSKDSSDDSANGINVNQVIENCKQDKITEDTILTASVENLLKRSDSFDLTVTKGDKQFRFAKNPIKI